MTTNQTKHFVLDRLLKMALRRETSFSGYASFNGAGVRFATDVPLRTRPALGGPPPGYINGPGGLAGEEPVEDNDPGPPRGKRFLHRIYDGLAEWFRKEGLL